MPLSTEIKTFNIHNDKWEIQLNIMSLGPIWGQKLLLHRGNDELVAFIVEQSRLTTGYSDQFISKKQNNKHSQTTLRYQAPETKQVTRPVPVLDSVF